MTLFLPDISQAARILGSEPAATLSDPASNGFEVVIKKPGRETNHQLVHYHPTRYAELMAAWQR